MQLDLFGQTIKPTSNLDRNTILSQKEDLTFLVAFSGGKDSVAMVLDLIDKGVDKSKIILHHHEVDGRGQNLFDWKCTTSYCRAFAKALGLKILFSYREGGIVREMYRENEGLQDVLYQREQDGEFIRIKSKEGNSTRHKFPAVSASLMTRWCSAVAKIDVLSRVMSNNPDYKTGRYVICTGERREESANRSKYAEVTLHTTNTKKGRKVYQWRSIIDWSEENVWAIMANYKIQCHPCYELGWSRCSCQTCIFSSPNVWATIEQLEPQKIEKISSIEQDIDHTLYNGMTIEQKVAKGNSFLAGDWEKWAIASRGEFNLPIFVEEWRLPKGAFGEEKSGSL